MQQQQSQLESLRPNAVATHVERIAKRLGCNDEQAEASAREATTALRNKESAHRAINAGVAHAARVTSPQQQALFVLGLILVFVAMVAPLASHAAARRPVIQTVTSQAVTIYTPVGAFFVMDPCSVDSPATRSPRTVTISCPSIPGRFLFDASIYTPIQHTNVDSVNVSFDGGMTWLFNQCVQTFSTDRDPPATFVCGSPFDDVTQ